MRPPLRLRSRSSYTSSSHGLDSRLRTIFKKSEELSVLCAIELCAIHYARDGTLQTWPEDKDKVRDLARRYLQIPKTLRSKKSFNLYDFLKADDENEKEKKHESLMALIKKKNNLKNPPPPVNVLQYPLADHYSPDQVSELIRSLKVHVSQYQTKLDSLPPPNHQTLPSLNRHQSLASSSSSSAPPLDLSQIQPSRQFSLYLRNEADNTLIPLSL